MLCLLLEAFKICCSRAQERRCPARWCGRTNGRPEWPSRRAGPISCLPSDSTVASFARCCSREPQGLYSRHFFTFGLARFGECHLRFIYLLMFWFESVKARKFELEQATRVVCWMFSFFWRQTDHYSNLNCVQVHFFWSFSFECQFVKRIFER